jgi:hypothetical protein
LTLPPVPSITVNEPTLTRIPSYRSSWKKPPAAEGTPAAVRSIAGGSALPLDTSVTVGVPAISVVVGPPDEGRNS